MMLPESCELREGNRVQVECCDSPVQHAVNIPIASSNGKPKTANHAEAFNGCRPPFEVVRLMLEQCRLCPQ